MTWGFQVCGPNEAMVVSGEIHEDFPDKSMPRLMVGPFYRFFQEGMLPLGCRRFVVF
jgi:hypothetical protein